MILLVLVTSIGLAYVTRPLFLNLLIEGELVRENYQGKPVVLGMGLYIFFNLAVIWSGGFVIGLYPLEIFFPILLLTGIFSFLGFIDDLLGNRKARGFVGHFRCLFQGKLTTGGLKALGAAVISFALVIFMSSDIVEAFVNWLALLLVTNFINLLDLRPGRALKVFSASVLLLLLLYWYYVEIWVLAIPLIPVLVFYFPLDLEARAMMGDTGANLLGGLLGYFMIQTVGFWGKVIIVFLLFFVHMFSERYSMSTMIEENRLLNWLDHLGRPRPRV